ncbi:hypothetical protein EXIGLDRAFT_47732 [Exidia glandulosa HHB12029]|uniref:Uncharacterized protein n=1 Tax=Exidia glandulosa HHB12029 TaxID=1314781 RepID=A0A165P5P7_EXIGL|nr:hypothetical protein EXIGLDRAFT_47732 [Exidia glandulosa HHB12029]
MQALFVLEYILLNKLLTWPWSRSRLILHALRFYPFLVAFPSLPTVCTGSVQRARQGRVRVYSRACHSARPDWSRLT